MVLQLIKLQIVCFWILAEEFEQLELYERIFFLYFLLNKEFLKVDFLISWVVILVTKLSRVIITNTKTYQAQLIR